MRASTFFEVFENAAFELKNIFEAELLQIRARFFAANSAGAKNHNRLFLHALRQTLHRFWKIAEVRDAWIDGALECAEAHFVFVARVQHRKWAAFVEPRFQCLRWQLRRRAERRIHRFIVEANDLLFDLDEHALERARGTLAHLRFKIFEARNATNIFQEDVDVSVRAADEHIDAFWREQHSAFQRRVATPRTKLFAEHGKIIEARKFVRGDDTKWSGFGI